MYKKIMASMVGFMHLKFLSTNAAYISQSMSREITYEEIRILFYQRL